MNKSEVRKKMNQSRELLSKEEVQKKSEAIFENLLKNPYFFNAKTIFCYINIRNEVMTTPVLEFCKKHGKSVAVPKVKGKKMDFYGISDRNELIPGAFGIPEPPQINMCIPTKEDVILLPGLAFDKSGNRIGYGGGFYDRYLEQHREGIKIAVAYDFQITDGLEVEPTDIKPDYIVTESEMITIKDQSFVPIG
ncbi:MAG: 5-formyltetrahydrofolate cyclo-ligase [Lachnospiraceae bacterium]|nr:5-formyltetrahydrofolate cyclo-ligase [Lachnospiraceae bacterium]